MRLCLCGFGEEVWGKDAKWVLGHNNQLTPYVSDPELDNALYDEFKPLAKRVALSFWKILGHGDLVHLEREDLEQEGLFYLLRIKKRLERAENARHREALAYLIMKNAMFRYITKNKWRPDAFNKKHRDGFGMELVPILDSAGGLTVDMFKVTESESGYVDLTLSLQELLAPQDYEILLDAVDGYRQHELAEMYGLTLYEISWRIQKIRMQIAKAARFDWNLTREDLSRPFFVLKPAECGTLLKYGRGCRCDECREAARINRKAKREAKKNRSDYESTTQT